MIFRVLNPNGHFPHSMGKDQSHKTTRGEEEEEEEEEERDTEDRAPIEN